MKRFLEISCLAIVLIATLLVGQTNAQTSNVMFTDAQTCVANLGKVAYYTPLNLSGKEKNPVNGKTKVRAQLEQDACAFMITMSGWRWVPLKVGTYLRYDVDADGIHTAYAHDDCANTIKEVVYPAPPASPLSSVEVTPEPVTQPVVPAAAPAQVVNGNVPCTTEVKDVVEPSRFWQAYDKNFPVDVRETHIPLPCGGTLAQVRMSKDAMKMQMNRDNNAAAVAIQESKDNAKVAKLAIEAAKDPCTGGWFNLNQYNPGCNGNPPLQPTGVSMTAQGGGFFGGNSVPATREGYNYVPNSMVSVSNGTPTSSSQTNHVGITTTGGATSTIPAKKGGS